MQGGIERLGAQYAAEGHAALFGALKRFLSQPGDATSYAAAGERLAMSADAVAMAVARLRRRYREIVREEVAHTVASPAQVDEEMRYLVELLAR